MYPVNGFSHLFFQHGYRPLVRFNRLHRSDLKSFSSEFCFWDIGEQRPCSLPWGSKTDLNKALCWELRKVVAMEFFLVCRVLLDTSLSWLFYMAEDCSQEFGTGWSGALQCLTKYRFMFDNFVAHSFCFRAWKIVTLCFVNNITQFDFCFTSTTTPSISSSSFMRSLKTHRLLIQSLYLPTPFLLDTVHFEAAGHFIALLIIIPSF